MSDQSLWDTVICNWTVDEAAALKKAGQILDFTVGPDGKLSTITMQPQIAFFSVFDGKAYFDPPKTLSVARE